jgi:tetratricopeptide (TPR) repeat protein
VHRPTPTAASLSRTPNSASTTSTPIFIGWHQVLRGEPEQAIASCQRAIDLHRETGDRTGEAAAWDSLGYAHHHLGQHRQATTCYQRALDVYRETDDRYEQARTLTNLGDTHAAADNPARADDAWQHALAILTKLGHADADQVQAKLHDLSRPTAPKKAVNAIQGGDDCDASMAPRRARSAAAPPKLGSSWKVPGAGQVDNAVDR